MSPHRVPDPDSWLPSGHGTEASRRDITDLTTGRIPDPRAKLRREMWRILYPLMTSAGWRTLRDRDLDIILDAIDAAYRPSHRIIELE